MSDILNSSSTLVLLILLLALDQGHFVCEFVQFGDQLLDGGLDLFLEQNLGFTHAGVLSKFTS